MAHRTPAAFVLHAALFTTAGFRKVILATNIAESSITFDDVAAVVDSCRVNLADFDAANNLPTLGPQVRRICCFCSVQYVTHNILSPLLSAEQICCFTAACQYYISSEID